MLVRLWNRYRKVWPALTKTSLHFYSIAAGLGLIMFLGAISHSRRGIITAWMALIALILFALPEYFLPCGDDESL
jgi:hypothetical protein